MFMTLATSLVVLFNCYTTADILTKFLQQYFLFFIVVVIPGQVSVYRTIGPTLVILAGKAFEVRPDPTTDCGVSCT